MFFGKKDEERQLPDLPEPKYASSSMGYRLRETEDNEKVLPAFPDSPSGKRFSETAVKGAEGYRREERIIGPPPEEEREDGSSLVEMEEWEPSYLKSEDTGFPVRREHEHHHEHHREHLHYESPRIEAPPRMDVEGMEKKRTSQPTDVFVKIDKFHSARRALSEIKGKLHDIDELIKKIRETKLREEQELANWERDVMHIKSRVESVNENIFEKVD